jgi:hypothetical protein
LLNVNPSTIQYQGAAAHATPPAQSETEEHGLPSCDPP